MLCSVSVSMIILLIVITCTCGQQSKGLLGVMDLPAQIGKAKQEEVKWEHSQKVTLLAIEEAKKAQQIALAFKVAAGIAVAGAALAIVPVPEQAKHALTIAALGGSAVWSTHNNAYLAADRLAQRREETEALHEAFIEAKSAAQELGRKAAAGGGGGPPPGPSAGPSGAFGGGNAFEIKRQFMKKLEDYQSKKLEEYQSKHEKQDKER
eukprot:gnl/MRDRNA2_/MRDRNA2_79197_c0_seq1.p1 gnl/MRDRNA2_/MRDRNA2_79197_c0~~gnl/MRDRNA2_/MRDRNA2_79197_c0_seq1.p1  ORF type:complete len:208 (+),score=55.56 gnl/MRDRNA2_/MRDRNA2_79197_c0_seq1:50-673(+)